MYIYENILFFHFLFILLWGKTDDHACNLRKIGFAYLPSIVTTVLWKPDDIYFLGFSLRDTFIALTTAFFAIFAFQLVFLLLALV